MNGQRRIKCAVVPGAPWPFRRRPAKKLEARQKNLRGFEDRLHIYFRGRALNSTTETAGGH